MMPCGKLISIGGSYGNRDLVTGSVNFCSQFGDVMGCLREYWILH